MTVTESEMIRPFYGHIEGLDKPVSRMMFGTAITPMIAGEKVNELLDVAVEAGMTSFDTARGYGKAENVLGSWMAERKNREKLMILSKCGDYDLPHEIMLIDEKRIRTELDQSLKALGTDYVDIFLLHRDDPKTSIEEYMETLNDLKKAGKVRILGVSNWKKERIEEANAYAASKGLAGFSVSSPNFCLAEQVFDMFGGDCVSISGRENAEKAWYRDNQMPVVAYSSLARGLFTGKVKSGMSLPEIEKQIDSFAVKGFVSEENMLRLKRCEELAEKKGCTVAQLAMAWVFSQGLNVFAAVSTTKVERLKANLKAMTIELTKEEADWLNLED